MAVQRQHVITALGRGLIRRRWAVFVAGALIVLVVETIEHWPAAVIFDRHFFNEIFFYGIVAPLLLWGVLAILARSLEEERPPEQVEARVIEDERKRIARDLHDQLAQNLGYLHFKLDQLATSGDATLKDIEAIQTDLEQMRQLANQAYEQVRGTLDALRAQPEAAGDLAAALRQQAQAAAARSDLEIQVEVGDDVKSICPLVKRTIAAIATEALSNVRQHARASRVTIRVACHQADASLVVSDNGAGFDAGSRRSNGHYGLEIMRERAEEVGGSLNVESAAGRGTTVTAHFPNSVVCKPLLNKCIHENLAR